MDNHSEGVVNNELTYVQSIPDLEQEDQANDYFILTFQQLWGVCGMIPHITDRETKVK